VADEATARAVASALVDPILEPASTVRAAEVRLTRLSRGGAQAVLFPDVARRL
jgi:hypothetical protein